MQVKDSKLSFAGQTIYAGLDVGKKSWKVSILTDECEHKTFTRPPDPVPLVRYLRQYFPGAEYRSVYEAGYFGFWIHEALEQQGVDCLVVHPADVPTTDKEKRNRNDRVDARKLARSLRNGELQSIYVPPRSFQEDRSLVRLRSQLVRKQTRCKNQILGMLTLYGITVPEALARSRWSRRFIAWLEQVTWERASGDECLRIYVSELQHLRASLAQVTRPIRHLAKQEPYRKLAECLDSVSGISLVSAIILLTEVVDIHRFKDLDRLASYVGLKPGEDSSGDQEIVTGLTRRRNAFLRWILIECSWIAVRKDPALLQSFNALSKRMPKNQAIIRIARKLLNRIRWVWLHQQPYVIGVVA